MLEKTFLALSRDLAFVFLNAARPSSLINDLDTPADMWKYVDDTSISETVEKGRESNLQRVVDDLSRQSNSEGFQLNEAKCIELRISFANRLDL